MRIELLFCLAALVVVVELVPLGGLAAVQVVVDVDRIVEGLAPSQSSVRLDLVREALKIQ
jgi:hypothetical protein